jgi:hypothetical protein
MQAHPLSTATYLHKVNCECLLTNTGLPANLRLLAVRKSSMLQTFRLTSFEFTLYHAHRAKNTTSQLTQHSTELA